MLEDKMKERDGLYNSHLHKKKTRDMTDRKGSVHARRQNERTQWIVWVSSTLKQNTRHDGSYELIRLFQVGVRNQQIYNLGFLLLK